MRPTLSYSVIHDRNLTALFQSAARNLSLGPVVSCSTPAELSEYLLLHENDPADPSICAIADVAALPDLRSWRDLAAENRKRCAVFYALLDGQRPPTGELAAGPVTFLPKPGAVADAELLLLNVLRDLRQAAELRDLKEAVRRLRHAGGSEGDFSHGALMAFLDREWKRCLRYEWPISAVLLRVRCSRGRLTRSYSEIAAALAPAVHRPGDMIALLDRRGEEYIAAVLSETDAGGADHVARRLAAQSRQILTGICEPGGLELHCGTATLSPLEVYRAGPPNQQLQEAADVLLEAAHARLQALPAGQ